MSSQTEALQRISRLTPLLDLLKKVAAVAPVPARETGVAEASGMTLASDAVAAGAIPPVAAALRDGWAVTAAAISDAGPYAPVPLTSHAWVEAGGRMPDGADAVLPVDAVNVSASGAEALAPAAPGDGVLPQGGDAASGAVLRRAGQILRGADVAALRMAGVQKVSVRGPRVAIFSVRIATRSREDFITPMIVRAVEQAGGMAEIVQASTLDAVLSGKASDFVISVGGTGSGKKDGSIKTLARIGRVEAHGFGIAPGETAAFGFANERPVLMLPGRLDAALAAFLIVGTEIIARLAGRDVQSSSATVKLAKKITSTAGLAEMIPVRHVDDGVEPLAAGMLTLASLSNADGWVLVPPQSEGFAAGSTVEMRPLP